MKVDCGARALEIRHGPGGAGITSVSRTDALRIRKTGPKSSTSMIPAADASYADLIGWEREPGVASHGVHNHPAVVVGLVA